MLKYFLLHTVMLGYLILLAVLKAMFSFTVDSLRYSTNPDIKLKGAWAAQKNKMAMSVRRAALDFSLRHHLNPWAVVVSQNLANIV